MYLKKLLLSLLLLTTFQMMQAGIKTYQPHYERIDPTTITIARDAWGVPHIMAPTDAAVAYGLAWANAEDDFYNMQEALIATSGFGGRKMGKDGVAIDFYVHAIGADIKADTSLQHMDPDYLKYLDGYCQGINAYAKAHPDQCRAKKVFPLEPRDLIKAYYVTFSAICGIPGSVERAFTGRLDKQKSENIDNDERIRTESPEGSNGSNAFAIGPSRTEDGHTYFCTNPHFMVEGPLTFYEAHLMSEEGLNCAGAIFQGYPCIALGSNENLGWGHTWNYFDRMDEWKLVMHPKKPRQYRFDGEWRKLQRRPVWLKVKIGKFLRLGVRKKSYWSVHGPVIKSKNRDFYAIGGGGLDRAGSAQQHYLMNKARSWEEFRKVLDRQQLPMFNLIYGDKDGNVFYLHNGLIPERSDVYNWRQVLPGDTSAALYRGWKGVDELQQEFNPECGYVFNTNNNPDNATCAEDQLDQHFPDWMNDRPGDNNRSERFMELINSYEKFSFAQFQRIKYDQKYPDSSAFLSSIDFLYKVRSSDYPALAGIIDGLQGWDMQVDTGSIPATYAFLTMGYIFDKKGYGDGSFVTGVNVDTGMFIKGLQYAHDHLMEHWGTIEVPLGEVQRFYRHGKDYAVQGFADLLMANYAFPHKDGKYKLKYGDTYIHFADFGPDGLKELRTLLPFQTHSRVMEYEDQLPIYNKLSTKPLPMTREGVMDAAVRTYHPQ